MKKRFKLLSKFGKVFVLRWDADGRLFGPGWEVAARFDDNERNLERCRVIVRLMNECDKNKNEEQ